MRNDLPLGIIYDEIPQDVYHHTLNPNLICQRTNSLAWRKEQKNNQNKIQE
jgi:hypothetical protein